MLLPGTRLGPYKIVSQLGAGGMGEVYRAKDVRLDREIAVKVLSERLAGDPDAIVRFEREAKAVAALSHPNILAIHDFDRDGDVYFTASELLEGETLRTRISKSPIAWRKAAEIGIAIADGLAAAHSRGIIHRDLKPENIFLTAQGHVKILDFGLAAIKPQPKGGGQSSLITESADTEETVLGTVGYMSPEQVRGASVDGRSDIFSLGCVLYEMVTGKRAFSRETIFETAVAVLKEEPPDLSESGKKIPAEMQRLIHHCLEKNPNERLQSAHDLAFDLRAILATADSSRATPVVSLAKSHRTVWILGALLLLLLLLGVLANLFIQRSRVIRSVAVLPFADAGGNPNIEYLSEGISESIINRLSQLSELRVMARSTVFRYKGRAADPETVGHDLKVDAVLTGSMVQKNDNLIIKAELVKVADGSQLWGENYNARVNAVLPVQEEIFEKVVERLRLKLTDEEQKGLTKHYTKDTDAYNLYLKGRYYWNKRSADGLKKGIDFFQQAIDKDPTYALAYGGLADSYALMADYMLLAPEESFARAKAAALKALDIDPDLAEAHTSLGHIYVYYWDWPKAGEEFTRAIELNPGYATVHQWYANYLTILGRQSEAIAELKIALERDPLSLIINEAMGWHLYLARQYTRAEQQIQKTLELSPGFAPAHSVLSSIYVKKGMYREAIAETQKAIQLSNDSPDKVAELGYDYAVSGHREQALQVLEELKQRSKQKYVSPISIALIYVGLGEKDQAFEWLQKAYEEHSEFIVFLKVDPAFDSIRSDARFQKLLKLIGL